MCNGFETPVSILSPCTRSNTSSLQLVQVFKSRKHNLLTRLLNLAGKKDLVQDSVDLTIAESVQSLNTTLPISLQPPPPSDHPIHARTL
jgi:hypothetical protein